MRVKPLKARTAEQTNVSFQKYYKCVMSLMKLRAIKKF